MPDITEQELSEFDRQYEQSSTERSSVDVEVPDGRYQVEVESVVIGRCGGGKSKGLPMLTWTMKIIGGNESFLGRKLWKNSVVNQQTIPFIKQDMTCIGLTIEPFSRIRLFLDLARGKRVEISKSTDGEYKNIYLNRSLDTIEDHSQIKSSKGNSEDDIPF